MPVAGGDLRQQREDRVAEVARARDQLPRLAGEEPVRLRVVDLAARDRLDERERGRPDPSGCPPPSRRRRRSPSVERALVARHDRGADAAVPLPPQHELDPRVGQLLRDDARRAVRRGVVDDEDAVDELGDPGERRRRSAAPRCARGRRPRRAFRQPRAWRPCGRRAHAWATLAPGEAGLATPRRRPRSSRWRSPWSASCSGRSRRAGCRTATSTAPRCCGSSARREEEALRTGLQGPAHGRRPPRGGRPPAVPAEAQQPGVGTRERPVLRAAPGRPAARGAARAAGSAPSGLRAVSLAGYVVLAPLLYLLLRLWFPLRIALPGGGGALLVIEPLRTWSSSPLTDSWGLALGDRGARLRLPDADARARAGSPAGRRPILVLGFTRDLTVVARRRGR